MVFIPIHQQMQNSKMARFSVGGDEDENEEERPNDRRSSKKPRIADPVSDSGKPPNAAAVSTPNSGDRAKASTSSAPPLPPDDPIEEDEEFENEEFENDEFEEENEEEESDHPPSDSPAASEEESDAEECEVQATEARVDSEGDTGSITVTITDKDALDCPICFDPLSAPIYQCENGHIACESCCNSMYKKCASCQWPIGYNRCRAIERVVESVLIRCRNMVHGCPATLNYSKKLDHERTCIYAPCSCPHIRCDYVGMSKSLYAHFATRHPQAATNIFFDTAFTIEFYDSNTKHVFLRERSRDILFIVNRCVLAGGSSVNVVRVAPSSAKREFSYSLTATSAYEADSSIKLKTRVESMPIFRPEEPATAYLLVPNDFMRTNGKLVLEVMIRKVPFLAS
ncbi:hypothetical protein ABFS83_08G067300 [Erythranthe nasuta]